MAEQRVTYSLTEDQELVKSTARQFIAERVPLEKVRTLMMSDDGFDEALWKEMASLGWTGLAIDEQHGGAGLGLVEMSVLLEEMGRMVTPGPFFASAVLATTALQEMASGSRQADYLPALATGDTIATLAIFEPGRGWSLEPEATAARDGDRWMIDGTKRAVLDAHIADVILLTARTDDGVALFAVDPSAEGVDVSQETALDPTRRQATVRMERLAVPADAKLDMGDVSDGLERTLRLATVALSAEQVGGAQSCMEQSVEYAKTRHQFGRPIGSYQSIKHRCANMLMNVEHARSASYYAARVSDDEDELAVAAPLAGSVASEAYTWVAGENIQVHGGIGFTWEHVAHIYLKRAKASSLLLGSARHHRDAMGRALGI